MPIGPSSPGTLRPSYAANFECIGSRCEVTCCQSWKIPLDRNIYERYQDFPADELGSLVSRHVSRAAPDSSENLFAQIKPLETGLCPFFNTERLCSIQQKYGAPLLSATCSVYPRVLNLVEGVLEGSLTLSCPEAARNILLAPDTLEQAGDLRSGAFRTDNRFSLATNRPNGVYKPYKTAHQCRAVMVALIKDRARPMWQRLLLIGLLCQRLNGITSSEQEKLASEILDEGMLIVGTDWGRGEMEFMPANYSLKMSVIFHLMRMRLEDPTCGKGFRDHYSDVVEGVSSLSDNVQHYREAEVSYYQPFMAQRPYILENFLINDVLRTLFPFGREGSSSFVSRPIFDEYILLATRFGWLTGMLVGIAGRYKDEFSEEHVIRVVQAQAKEVDQDLSAQTSILTLMRARGLDNLQGIAVMLKN